MKEKFAHDLRMVIALKRQEQQDIHRFYEAARSRTGKHAQMMGRFLRAHGLEELPGAWMALATKAVTLRDDALVQVVKQAGWDEERIIKLKEASYLWVADLYLSQFERLLARIDSLKLLTPFYRAILKGAHQVGRAMSQLNSSWTAQVVHGSNRMLARLFEGDEAKIIEHLASEELFDTHEGEVAERCYSVLVQKADGSFVAKSYAEAFEEEVSEVLEALATFKASLEGLEDEIYGEAGAWRDYLGAMYIALAERDRHRLIGRWQDVERAWMRITGPIQIGHPLEYYEDHYRRAVALEWDLRIDDPDASWARMHERMPAWYEELFDRLSTDEHHALKEISVANLRKVQLHIGIPLFYYGALFCGLFSAQVVPNDETVSWELGKKIFAYASMILESERAKPFYKIQEEVFEPSVLERYRRLLFKEEGLWYRVYDASTIGHECGHILWIDRESERKMNISGQFKNIEEFKATAGGLVAVFSSQDESLKEAVLVDHLRRLVALLAWRESSEALAYYIEALLHLSLMFESGYLRFDGKKLLVQDDRRDHFFRIFTNFYEELVRNYYLAKADPAPLLASRLVREEDGSWLPAGGEVRSFVLYYWVLYQQMGQETIEEQIRLKVLEEL
ncbi:MAG: invasion protein CiaB [Campylobacterales bacterium]